ncbi:hypothetical protein L218DRAFT_945803 [Marasmius fiardii PR-910]|nr:hypothetical protein L218DRAFT_945803 [Marasmius fiardii PR-910]
MAAKIKDLEQSHHSIARQMQDLLELEGLLGQKALMQLKESEDRIVSLSRQLEEMHAENLELRRHLDTIYGNAEQLRRENARVKSELSEVKGELQSLQADIFSLGFCIGGAQTPRPKNQNLITLAGS